MYLTYKIYKQTLDELKPYGFKEYPRLLNSIYKNNIYVEFPIDENYIIVFLNKHYYTNRFFIYWDSPIKEPFDVNEEKYKIDRFQTAVDVMKYAETFDAVKMLISQKNIEYMLDRLDR